ncbi:MAG: 16S rRNA (cytidine(1402)-2'-O)-methyltransferase [Deltaproteobacteria bacterium]|nr:16S rRNA (cytidine(1402)-2'-O)-methyltransferase [Deltaproteobacteria bacterium]
MSVLVLVPTPIGNLGDITLRAIETLKTVSHIVAEDTRHSRKLLSHLEIDGSRMSRLDANATEADRQRVIDWLLEGQDVALITDAGSPAVSDPGSALVRDAIRAGIQVIALPGASAVTAAVAVSGLVDNAFRFVGFLPRSGPDRARAITDISTSREPVVLFESAQRMEALLGDLGAAMAAREIVVAREVSKLHEEIVRSTLGELAQSRREWLGEITIVLGAWEPSPQDAPTEEDIDRRIDEELAAGVHTRTASEKIAAWCGKGRREIYARVLERKGMNSRRD